MDDSPNPTANGSSDDPEDKAERAIGVVRSVNINEEMRGSYLDYAMSVIVSRALPDARDGLKPVHRRILYAMHDMGLRPNTAHKKSARIVGEVLGKYHPHGDGAVYDAMARMAQTFSLRYVLVDGQGNFGSVDGDSPAAMRYTEARMASIADEILADINMDTVDFVDNYDGTQQEPSVMPARLPNLLLNGATGIAVGMATSIPPHNLTELVQAIHYMIDNIDRLDDVTVDDLMQFVHGPDFPTGAQIIIDDALKEAYATGKGRVTMRAHHEIEEGRNGELRIVFSSFPYQVGKTSIIERIVQLVRDGKLDGVRDLRDESDRDGQRLVVELKRSAHPQKLVNRLYKYTPLQSNFSINMLALINGEPRTLSLKRALQVYIDHRYEVIVRRSEYELDRRRARAHILEGLLKALSSLDEIIRTIRASADVDTARAQLMTRFDLSEAQANAILEMQLRRLSALERQKLQDEYDEVMARIAELEELLSSPVKIRGVIRDELGEVAEKFGDTRRTEIVLGSADINEADLIADEQVVISMTANGYIKRVQASAYRAQKRGGKGVIGMQTREEDVLTHMRTVETHDTLLFFSNRGKVYSIKAWDVPEAGRANRGTLVHTILPLDQNERVTTVLNLRFDPDSGEAEDSPEDYIIMATRAGRIKRLLLEQMRDVRHSGIIAMGLADDDEVGWVKRSREGQDVLLVTALGQCIRFSVNDDSLRVTGRQAAGVNAIRLTKATDRVVTMEVIDPEDTHVLVVSRRGYGKRTPINEYPVHKRYGQGVRTLQRTERTGDVVAMRCLSPEDSGLMLITRSGIVLRTEIDEVRETGRSTQGVRLMNVADDDEVVGITLINTEDDDNPPGADAAQPIANAANDSDGA